MMGFVGFSGPAAGAAAGAVAAGTAGVVDMVAAGLAGGDCFASGLSGARPCTSSKDSCEEPDGLSSAGKSVANRSGVSGNDSSFLSSILVRLCSVDARYPTELTFLSVVFVEDRLDGLLLYFSCQRSVKGLTFNLGLVNQSK
jgi:hypothetical protein